MKAKDFLTLAQNLSNESNNEAALRTSVSRSYYALHNFISLFISKEGFSLPEGAEKHRWIIHDLNNCNIPNIDIATIASILNDLREERNIADYNLESNDFQEPNKAKFSYLKANSAYDDFEKIISNSNNRKKIVKEINTYRKKIQR